MRFQRLAIVLIAISMTAMFLGSLAPAAQASPGDMHIFEPTNTDMNVDMDTSATYKWGIYNNGSHPHTILIDIYGEDFGWTAEVINSYFMIAPDEFVNVDVVVTAPNTRDYPERTFSLNATVRDLVTEEMWYRDMGNITVTITGGAYIPPTKVLGLFDDPLGKLVPALDNEWGVFTTTVIIWLIIGGFIYFILDPVVKHFTKQTKTDIDDHILAIVKGPVFGLIVLYGMISSLEVLNFSYTVVHTLETLYSLTLIILGCWMAYKIMKDVLLIWGKNYAAKSETTLDDVMLPLFEKLGMVVIFIAAIMLILQLFGIDVTMLAAGMGVMGLVIAFAAQDTLGNFISGMFLLTDRPFKIGDLVLMENGDYCRVEHIGMRSTKLYNTFDHDMIILPNSKIANEKVINLTEPDQKMKVNVSIGVDYKTNIQQAKKIMLDTALNHPDIMQDDGHKPFVRLVEFADSAINLKLYTWVFHLDNQWRVAGELREIIFEKFKAEGIDIPFPQRVLHMDQDFHKPGVQNHGPGQA